MATKPTVDMARRRALLTDSERELIANEDPETPNRKYQAISRVRTKIQDELTEDVGLLAEHHDELHRELRETVCDDEGLPVNELRDALADAREAHEQVNGDDLGEALDRLGELLGVDDGE